MMKIGFVGAGIMGHGMACSLRLAGYPLTVIAHRNRAPIDDLVNRGAQEATNLAELADRSDAIILCVSNSKIVEQVIADLTPNLRRSMMIVDTGTSSPASSRHIAEELATLGVDFVEAPVTGGVKQAAAGELGALVGCSETAFQRARPLLEAMCKTVHYFGEAGAGNTAKLINNYMVMGIVALITEAFTKAQHSGLDWRKFYEVVICGSADSGALRRIIGNAIEDDFKGYVFDLDGALKDMSYFCELSQDLDGISPMAAAVKSVYAKAVADGHGDRLLSELLAPDLIHQPKTALL